MKIENQVCTLKQANRLKELGVTQDSILYYYPSCGELLLKGRLVTKTGTQYKKVLVGKDLASCSAFTVAELGEMLADNAQIPAKSHDGDYWYIYLDKYEQFKTEAQTRAALLIYFLEKGGITATEVNQRLQNS